jgi:hypothetical protein
MGTGPLREVCAVAHRHRLFGRDLVLVQVLAKEEQARIKSKQQATDADSSAHPPCHSSPCARLSTSLRHSTDT